MRPDERRDARSAGWIGERALGAPAAHRASLGADVPRRDQNRTCGRRVTKAPRGRTPAGIGIGEDVGRQCVPAQIGEVRKGGHWRLLMLKRLAQAREGVAAQASAHQRLGLDGNTHSPSTERARKTAMAGGEAPTVALLGLGARSRVHGIPWTGCGSARGRVRSRRTFGSEASRLARWPDIPPGV